VFQGFSIGIDAHRGNLLAFFAGATLVIGTHDMVHAARAFPEYSLKRA